MDLEAWEVQAMVLEAWEVQATALEAWKVMAVVWELLWNEVMASEDWKPAVKKWQSCL